MWAAWHVSTGRGDGAVIAHPLGPRPLPEAHGRREILGVFDCYEQIVRVIPLTLTPAVHAYFYRRGAGGATRWVVAGEARGAVGGLVPACLAVGALLDRIPVVRTGADRLARDVAASTSVLTRAGAAGIQDARAGALRIVEPHCALVAQWRIVLVITGALAVLARTVTAADLTVGRYAGALRLVGHRTVELDVGLDDRLVGHRTVELDVGLDDRLVGHRTIPLHRWHIGDALVGARAGVALDALAGTALVPIGAIARRAVETARSEVRISTAGQKKGCKNDHHHGSQVRGPHGPLRQVPHRTPPVNLGSMTLSCSPEKFLPETIFEKKSFW